MKRLALTVVAMVLAAGCSTTPTVTRTKTTMTRAQIAAMNLECKRIKPIDTNMPKMICASEKAWNAYGETTREATEDLLRVGRAL